MYLKINLALIALSIPLAFVLPPEIAFENGPIENLQVLVLLTFVATNLKWCLQATNSQLKWFHIFSAALMFLFALRELSYGRVFFQMGTEASGAPIFMSMADFPYRTPIHIFLTIYMLAMLFILIKFIPIKKMLLSSKPIDALLIMVIAISISQMGERGYIIGKEYGEIVEELNELIAYSTFIKICDYYHKHWS